MMTEDGKTIDDATSETAATENGTTENGAAETGATDEAVSGSDPENSYERVMLMALEARRLNTRHLERRIEPKERITTQAINRVKTGEVKLVYRTSSTEKTESESTFMEVSDDA